MTRRDDHDRKQRQGDLELDPERVKDLDVDESDAEHVQGGQSYGASAPTHQR